MFQNDIFLFLCRYTMEKFKTTELKENTGPVFTNDNSIPEPKSLTDRDVARRALEAVFRDKPDYFKDTNYRQKGLSKNISFE